MSGSVGGHIEVDFKTFDPKMPNRYRTDSKRSSTLPPRTQHTRPAVEHLLRQLPRPMLSLLKQCTSISTFKQIHSQTITGHVPIHNHLLSKLLDLRDLPYSLLLFSQIPSPNDYAFNVLIRGLVTAWRDHHLALQFYLRMLRSGERPNNFTYPFVLLALAGLRRPGHGRATHSSIFKSGLHADPHTQHSLITMYARCGIIESARRVFDEITQKDLVSWNSMISGYSRMGFAREAVGMFRAMREATEMFEPDEMTVVSVLAACAGMGDLRLGRMLEEFVVEKGFELTTFIGSALVDMYGKCGDLESARRVFESMPTKDRVSWNAMITGYSQNGRSEEAIALFQVMRKTGTEPDKITMVGVLSASASVGALEIGRWVDAWALERGLLGDVYIATALIDMYAKCGNLGRAAEIFQGMPSKNEVTWNAMISAYAFHGQAHEALSLFVQMKDGKENIPPDEVTFVGVLSACVHAGWVDEGRKWFQSMKLDFDLTPEVEHYSCMVDLLARAGHVEEAWSFIQKMPAPPDAVMLGSLLSACRKCKNVEVGDRVIKHLLELEPSNSGNYVISSKVYASSGRWDDSAKMRGLMRDKGVSKTPGCSWIEILNQLHEFRSGDGLDLTSAEMAQMMDMLNEEMRRDGYKPDIDLV